MNITVKWLKDKNACKEGLEWLVVQKESNSIKIIEKLIEEKQLD